MPAINFQPRFALDVECRRKRQTIRKEGKRRWKIGDTLYLYTGMRTKNCRLLGTAVALEVRMIFIDTGRKCIALEYRDDQGRRCIDFVSDDEALALARADGFATLDDFFAFFAKTHGTLMRGYLINW
jgi:hypothetical protein